ncbi:MAG: hypothetical protein ACLRXP_04570 [Oscillospiraceae bacterium]
MCCRDAAVCKKPLCSVSSASQEADSCCWAVCWAFDVMRRRKICSSRPEHNSIGTRDTARNAAFSR